MCYFDARALGNPKREFVFWVDCMGTQCFMQRSIDTAANFIFIFQSIVASKCASYTDVHVYPVMDGAYITSPKSSDILVLAGNIMKELAILFTEEKNVHFRFLVRGAISYGYIYHGDDISEDAFMPTNGNQKAIKIKRESILLGTPVIQAYRQESIAPPFGIALHNSCKLDLDRNKHFNNEWLLWAGASRELIDELKKCVNEYFEYYKWQTSYSGYSEDKIKEHMIDFAQYVHLFEFLAKET